MSFANLGKDKEDDVEESDSDEEEYDKEEIEAIK